MAIMTTTYFTSISTKTRPSLTLGLQVLLLFLVPPARSGTIRGTVLTCHPRDRDPCANFPELCSAGNGLCVVKKPCEYECVCPPDGRVGRDCSNGNSQPSDGTGQNPADTTGTASNDKQVDSLLVFPPDLFWDLNHVAQQEDMIKTMPSPDVTTAHTTTPQSNTKIAEVSTDPLVFAKLTAIAGTSTMMPATVARLDTTPKEADMVNLSLKAADKTNTSKGTTPEPSILTLQKLVNVFNSDFSTPATDATYTQHSTTSSYMTSNLEAFIPPTTHKVTSVLHTSPSPDTASVAPHGFLSLPESNVRQLNRPSDLPHLPGISSARDRATRLSNAVLEPPKTSFHSLHGQKSPSSATGALQTTASTTSFISGSTKANTPKSIDNPKPGHNSFPTFFAGKPSDAVQETSNNRALHQLVHRVFHPLDAFQMRPKP